MKTKALIALLFLFSVSLSAAAESSTPSGYWNNRKAVKEMIKGNPSEAQSKFLAGLAKDPFNSTLHLNLGLTFESLGQMEKARASYEVALQRSKTELNGFAAAFNLGETYQKEKKVDEALHFYQVALQFNPDSKETKTNIELLIQDQQGKDKDKDKDKDKKDGDGKGQGDDKDKGKDKDKDQDKKDDKGDSKDKPEDKKDEKPQQYKKEKPQPQKFKSTELTPGDVKKILGEIKQQEQKIRGEFNKKDVKETPRDKDW